MSDMSNSADSRVDIEVLAEEYLERRRHGAAVTVEDYAAEHPELADEIREVFPALEAMALLLMVAVVSVAGYRAERLQRQRAESVSEYAEQALDTVFDRYAQTSQSSEFRSDVSPTTTVLTKDAAEMLERLLPIFDRLAAMKDQSPAVRLRSITARKRVGDIHQRLGQFEEAINAYKRALSMFRQLAVSNVTDYQMQIAGLYNDIGSGQLMLGDTEEAAASHESALLQLQALSDRDSGEVRYQLARTHYLLARRLLPGQSPSTVDDFAPELGNHPPGPPGSGPPPGDRHRPRHGPPPGHRPRRRPNPPRGGRLAPSASHEHLHAAIELLESQSEATPLDPATRHLLATCLRSLNSDRFSGKRPEEQAAETRALEILAELVADYPDAPEYLYSQVDALAAISTRGFDSIVSEDLEAAEQRLRRAVVAGQDLVDRHPYVPEYSLTLIHAHNKLAYVLERRNAESQGPQRQFLQAAREQYETAARLQPILVKRFPDAASYRSWLQQFERSVARLTDEIADLTR
ncbi:MAG: tetratricopeptide repeat protein [Planctomycetaceae bacterium]